jgi:hypothetical protein
MKEHRKVSLAIVFVTGLVCLLLPWSAGQAQVKPKLPAGIQQGEKPTPSVAPLPTPQKTPSPQACIDLKVDLSFAARPSGTRGLVNLRGVIHSLGPADYLSPPGELVAEYYVDRRHPPRTYFQEGVGSVLLSRRSLPTIPKGGLFSFNQSYSVPDFIQWGHRAPAAGERQAVCKFTLLINRPGGGTIGRGDDCVPDNNQMTTVEVAYMESSATSGTANPNLDESASRLLKPGEARGINPQPEPPMEIPPKVPLPPRSLQTTD